MLRKIFPKGDAVRIKYNPSSRKRYDKSFKFVMKSAFQNIALHKTINTSAYSA